MLILSSFATIISFSLKTPTHPASRTSPMLNKFNDILSNLYAVFAVVGSPLIFSSPFDLLSSMWLEHDPTLRAINVADQHKRNTYYMRLAKEQRRRTVSRYTVYDYQAYAFVHKWKYLLNGYCYYAALQATLLFLVNPKGMWSRCVLFIVSFSPYIFHPSADNQDPLGFQI